MPVSDVVLPVATGGGDDVLVEAEPTVAVGAATGGRTCSVVETPHPLTTRQMAVTDAANRPPQALLIRVALLLDVDDHQYG